jgi:hypothetical protein
MTQKILIAKDDATLLKTTNCDPACQGAVG